MSGPVVTLATIEPGVVQVTMQDRVNHNAFSDALTLGLLEVFHQIESLPDAKAVILTGYDTYFATGGTREGLLALHEEKGSFADTNLYRLALDCPVPVIAAMQGHGIGGGFVMGLFADLVVLSRESVYTANFMTYGFTPGMGATWIVPQKLGVALGAELLLLGRSYRGEELKQRGVPFPVLPRKDVYPHALDMARSLAEKPRVALTQLKAQLTGPLRERLPEVVRQEKAMHAATFHQPGVRERILTKLGSGGGAT